MIANQTMKAGTDIAEVKAIFLARLGTLGSAHDLLTQTECARARLRGFVEGSLAHALRSSPLLDRVSTEPSVLAATLSWLETSAYIVPVVTIERVISI